MLGNRGILLVMSALLIVAERDAAATPTSTRFEFLDQHHPGIVVTRVITPTARVPRERFGGHWCEDGIFNDVDLFLPMTPNDVALAPFMFRSLEVLMPCFGDLMVLVNPGAEAMVLSVVPSYAYIFVVEDPLPEEYGYLTQQFFKMYSDMFSSRKYVLILETDMVVSTSESPSCYFNDKGQIRIFCIPYDSSVCGDGCDIWRLGIEHALGVPSKHECLLRTPVMIPRELFPGLRRHMEVRHRKPLLSIMEDYFPGHSKGWERTDILFSEFNIMHKFGMEYIPEQFEFIMLDRPGIAVDNCALHVGAAVKRNYDLENPKATAEYFQLATDAMWKGFCGGSGERHQLCARYY